VARLRAASYLATPRNYIVPIALILSMIGFTLAAKRPALLAFVGQRYAGSHPNLTRILRMTTDLRNDHADSELPSRSIPASESESDALRLDFERRLMLQFRSSVVTSDARG
jgi:hypothetical protein